MYINSDYFNIIDKYKKYFLTEKYRFFDKLLETLSKKEIELIIRENFSNDAKL